jgi:hypothetical protein
MTDETPPPPGYGEQQPPSYPSYPGQAGGAGGYGAPPPPPYGQGYGGGPGYGGYPGPQQQQSSTPTVLSVIGIVCWLFCSPAAIVLGLVAQSQYRRQGRPDGLAKTAWIGGIVLLVLGIIIAVAVGGHSGSNG